MQINLRDARDRLSELVDCVLNGEDVTICKRGEPVIDLVPTRIPKRKVPDFEVVKGTIRVIDPNHNKKPQTDEELEAWLRGEF